MMKSVTDESQERPNTTSDELSREFIMERVGDVGEGSPFVYDTVVTPMTDDALRSMKAYSDESFGNLSRVFDDLCEHDTGALPLDRTRMHHSMAPLREELEDIVSLE